jgi:hypothetical protein
MNIAEDFKGMLALSRDRRTTDAIMDAVFEAKLFKTGTPDHAKFYFEDGSGLAMDSYDDSDHQRMWTFDWEARVAATREIAAVNVRATRLPHERFQDM